MANRKTSRLIAAIIILVGAILLIAALLMPWYSVQFSESSPFGSASETTNLYPGLPSTNGTIQYSCSGAATCPSQTSYSSYHPPLNDTGMLAEAGFFILIGGIILGFIAAIIGVASRGKARRANAAVPLAVIALLLAVIAPVLFYVELPGAVSNDMKNHMGSGPWSSFIGSNSSTSGNITLKETWGPAIGWDLSIAAFVILLVGVALLARGRREPPEPAAAAPSTMGTPSMPPPASPPTS
jgi:hypothetical protein